MSSKLITSYVTKEDIDLIDKLNNMLGSEISDEVYEKCMDKKTFSKIEDKVWKLMRNSAEPFHSASYYDGLGNDWLASLSEKEEKSVSYSELKKVEVYNCDLLYMVAIASILKLERPKFSWDVSIFGM